MIIVTYSGIDELLAKFKAAPPLAELWMKQQEEIAGTKMLQYAKNNAPVDTGFLRDSIELEQDDEGVTVYTDAPYAEYLEYGTSEMHPQPFMFPALIEPIRTLPAAFLSFIRKVFW